MGNTLDKKGGVDPKYLLPQGSFSKCVSVASRTLPAARAVRARVMPR